MFDRKIHSNHVIITILNTCYGTAIFDRNIHSNHVIITSLDNYLSDSASSTVASPGMNDESEDSVGIIILSMNPPGDPWHV